MKNGSYSKELIIPFCEGEVECWVSYSQLSDKVYMSKKRFILMKTNKCSNDNVMRKFSDSNYEKLFELSNNIRGNKENPKLSEKDPSGRGWNNAEIEFQTASEKLKIDITFIPLMICKTLAKNGKI